MNITTISYSGIGSGVWASAGYLTVFADSGWDDQWWAVYFIPDGGGLNQGNPLAQTFTPIKSAGVNVYGAEADDLSDADFIVGTTSESNQYTVYVKNIAGVSLTISAYYMPLGSHGDAAAP